MPTVFPSPGTTPTHLFLLLGVVLAAACGDSPTEPVDDEPPCVTPAPVISLGEAVTGTLSYDDDCLQSDGRLADDFTLRLDTATLFSMTLETRGYFPLMPTYRNSVQLSGWASSTVATLTREHLFPTGTYVVRASSFEREMEPGSAPTGGYTLSTLRLDYAPQEGCGRETSVTYGSVARGRLSTDDCRDGTVDPSDARPVDGYDFLLEPGRAALATVVADFRYRFTHWDNGQPVDGFDDVPAGEARTFLVDGAGFHGFYLIDLASEGGSYTLTFTDG